VIDTGVTLEQKSRLCNFVDVTETSIIDHYPGGHGRHIHAIIEQAVNPKTTCLIHIKWKHGILSWTDQLITALKEAIKFKPNIVNISAGGLGEIKEESAAIATLIKNGAKVVVAAGNESTNLDLNCNYFPACLFRRFNEVIPVGALNNNGTKAEYSNYSKDLVWEKAKCVHAPNCVKGGTSIAAAVHTAKLLNLK
jgi:hypothetical protein